VFVNSVLIPLGRLYTRLTGEPYTPRMDAFVRHLSWLSVGFGVSKGLTILVNLGAGRWLGPSEYGLYGLTMSVGSFVTPVLVWGLQVAVVRYAAGQDAASRREIYGTAFTLCLALGVASLIVLHFFHRPLAAWAEMSPAVFRHGVFYGLAYSVFAFLGHAQQAEGKFKARAFSEMCFGMLSLAAVVILYTSAWKDYRALTLGLMGAYILAALVAAGTVPSALRPGFSGKTALLLLPYGALWMADSVGHTLQLYFLRFVVNTHLAAAEVGILSAYTMASILLGFYFLVTFLTVFFPSAAAHTDRAALWTKVLKVFRVAVLPLTLVFIASQYAALWLLGGEFPVRHGHILLFAATTSVAILQSVLGWLLISEGVRGFRWVVLVKFVSGSALIALGSWWVPQFGLTGAVCTYAAAYSLSLVLIFPAKRLLTRTT
jgi:O-antigen/teichoic acid export membrane protein